LLLLACLPALAQSQNQSTSEISPSTQSENAARGEGSFLWGQPGAGRSLVQIGASSLTQVIRMKGNYSGNIDESESKSYQNLLNLDLRYGLSRDFAIGVAASTGKEEDTSDSTWAGSSHYISETDSEGFSDPSLFGMYRHDLRGNLALIVRGSLSPSVGEHKYHSDAGKTSTGSPIGYTDRLRGGTSGSLSVGMETNGTNHLGGALNANFQDLRTTHYSNQSDDHQSGGNAYSASAYYEKNWNKISLSAALGYQHNTATVYSSDNSYGAGNYVDFGLVNLQSNIVLTKNVELVPSLIYERVLNTSIGNSNIEFQNIINAGVSAVIGI
jgi:hypothetical protein